MHKTQAYKTCDGKLFDDEAEAALHEAKLKIGKWTERKGLASDGMVSCDAIATAMIDDAEELAHLFVSLVRSLPKNSAVAFLDTFTDLPHEQNPLWRVNGVNGQRLAG